MKNGDHVTDPFTPEQREAIDAMLGPIRDRLDRGADKMTGLASGLAELRDELQSNTATTVEVRELLSVGKGGLRVLGWIGATFKWLAIVAGGITAVMVLLHALKTGVPPTTHKP